MCWLLGIDGQNLYTVDILLCEGIIMKRNEEIRLRLIALEHSINDVLNIDIESGHRDALIDNVHNEIESLKAMFDNQHGRKAKCSDTTNLAILVNVYMNNLVRIELDEIITKAVSSLTDREKFVLDQRVNCGASLADIAESLGVIMERVRQIEAKMYRKISTTLRHELDPAKIYPKISVVVEQESYPLTDSVTILCDLETSIKDMNLSARLYNALDRAKILTIHDIIRAVADTSIFQVRNLGKKGLAELREKLLTYGVDEQYLNGIDLYLKEKE